MTCSCICHIEADQKTSILEAVEAAVHRRASEKDKKENTQEMLRPDIYLTKEVLQTIMSVTTHPREKFRAVSHLLFSLGCPFPNETSRRAIIVLMGRVTGTMELATPQQLGEAFKEFKSILEQERARQRIK